MLPLMLSRGLTQSKHFMFSPSAHVPVDRWARSSTAKPLCRRAAATGEAWIDSLGVADDMAGFYWRRRRCSGKAAACDWVVQRDNSTARDSWTPAATPGERRCSCSRAAELVLAHVTGRCYDVGEAIATAAYTVSCEDHGFE